MCFKRTKLKGTSRARTLYIIFIITLTLIYGVTMGVIMSTIMGVILGVIMGVFFDTYQRLPPCQEGLLFSKNPHQS